MSSVPSSLSQSLTQGFNETEIIVAKTIQYLAVPSVVGHEQFFINHLHDDFQETGLTARKHPGLLEVHGSDPHAGIICAHIDRHGLISIGGNEYVYAAQYVKEIKYGKSNRASQQELEDIAKRFVGEIVFAYDPQTGRKLGKGIITACDPAMARGDALFHVEGMRKNLPQNIPIAYARMARAQNGYIKGQIDNAMSLGVVYALFKYGFQGTALLSTEEEIGKSWIHIADWLKQAKVETQNLLVLDTSPYMTEAPIDEGMVILRNRDCTEIFNPGLVQALKNRCDAAGMPYEMKDEVLLAKGRPIDQLGSTELGRLIRGTEGRWSGATVQIPTTMYHTSNETTTRKAILNYFGFLRDVLITNPLPTDIRTSP